MFLAAFTNLSLSIVSFFFWFSSFSFIWSFNTIYFMLEVQFFMCVFTQQLMHLLLSKLKGRRFHFFYQSFRLCLSCGTCSSFKMHSIKIIRKCNLNEEKFIFYGNFERVSLVNLMMTIRLIKNFLNLIFGLKINLKF